MNKIVRILPGIFLSLLSLSSCDGLFTEDCIYKGYLHARNGFHHPSDMGTPEQAEMNLMVFPLTGNGVAEYDNLSIPFNGSGDAYGTLHIGSYEFLACNKDVNILEDAGSAATVRLRVPTEQGKITAEQGYAYSSSVTGTVMTDDTLHVTCESKLMVQRIVFNITVTNTGILEYTGITAELDGVTTSRYVRTREKGSGFATLPFTVSPEKENFFRKEVLVFGIVGAVLMTLEFSVAPILLGFVLGPMVEENFRRALLLSRGDMSVFVTRPISGTFIGLCALLLLGVGYSAWRGRGGRKAMMDLPKPPEGAPPAEAASMGGGGK